MKLKPNVFDDKKENPTVFFSAAGKSAPGVLSSFAHLTFGEKLKPPIPLLGEIRRIAYEYIKIAGVNK